MKLLVTLGLSAFTVTAGAALPLSPQQAAAGFATALIAEQDVRWMSDSMTSFANLYSFDVLSKVGSSNITVAPCDFGGSVRISRLPGLITVLRAEYSECVTEQYGIRFTSRGQVEVAVVGVGSSQRMLWVRFGRFGHDFVREAQFYPEREPYLPPSTLMFDYWIAGDFQDRDESGNPTPGDYNLLVSGTLSEHYYILYWDNSVLEDTYIIEADSLAIRGGTAEVVEDIGGEQHTSFATTIEYSTGSLTYENYAPGSELEYLIKQWAFDDFKLVLAYDLYTGEFRRTISGSASVNKPATATAGCLAGKFEFDTPQVITESGEGTRDFTSGELQINGATIRFDTDDPRVEITAPGHASESFDSVTSLLNYANCGF